MEKATRRTSGGFCRKRERPGLQGDHGFGDVTRQVGHLYGEVETGQAGERLLGVVAVLARGHDKGTGALFQQGVVGGAYLHHHLGDLEIVAGGDEDLVAGVTAELRHIHVVDKGHTEVIGHGEPPHAPPFACNGEVTGQQVGVVQYAPCMNARQAQPLTHRGLLVRCRGAFFYDGDGDDRLAPAAFHFDPVAQEAAVRF